MICILVGRSNLTDEEKEKLVIKYITKPPAEPQKKIKEFKSKPPEEPQPDSGSNSKSE
jgi:hypothetical protein